MATKADLMNGLSEVSTQITRVEQLVLDLHSAQGVPEAELDEVLTAINSARDRLTAIV